MPKTCLFLARVVMGSIFCHSQNILERHGTPIAAPVLERKTLTRSAPCPAAKSASISMGGHMEGESERLRLEMLERLRIKLLRLPTDATVPGLRFYRLDSDVYTNNCFDLPMLILTVQGRKQLRASALEFELGPGIAFVNCVDMPSSSAVLEASPDRPYLSLVMTLDRLIFADLLTEMPISAPAGVCSGAAAWTMRADAHILGAFYRLADLAESPDYIPVLAPLIIRELHFLILASPNGHKLRHLYMRGARDGRIVDVITWLKQNVAAQTNMEDLARMAHMSVSSFHRHFKAITGLSPLQYHKKLRLHEAQRLMMAENERVSEAAMAVGYESISQFNREYRRTFGEAPRKDVSNRLKRLSRSGQR